MSFVLTFVFFLKWIGEFVLQQGWITIEGCSSDCLTHYFYLGLMVLLVLSYPGHLVFAWVFSNWARRRVRRKEEIFHLTVQNVVLVLLLAVFMKGLVLRVD